MPPTLRPALLTDLPAVYRGEQDYIQTWEPAHEDAWRRDLERHLSRWVEHFTRLTIAELDGRFAGYSLWMPEGDCAELATLNVSPEHRRRGLGRALLDAWVQAATQQGFVLLTLSVRHDNPARQLYEQAGFLQTGVSSNGYLNYQQSVSTSTAPKPASASTPSGSSVSRCKLL